jgi:hypothetical protein
MSWNSLTYHPPGQIGQGTCKLIDRTPRAFIKRLKATKLITESFRCTLDIMVVRKLKQQGQLVPCGLFLEPMIPMRASERSGSGFEKVFLAVLDCLISLLTTSDAEGR